MRTRTRMASALAATASAFLIAAGVVSLGSSQAAAATCTAGTTSDFNGDGVTDTVIADPNATVNGAKGAGLVRVVLGGGKGVTEISQATSGMGAAPEANDHFGFSRTTYDADGDGCTDLVVGVPFEDLTLSGTKMIDAGAVYVIHGTPTGIGAGSTIEGYDQAELDSATATEAYDWFGYAMKAGETASGSPYLVIGVPGEAITEDGTTYSDAGTIEYVQGTTVVPVSQKDPGVPGIVEANDRFGYSLTGTNRYFAVGAPGEAVGSKAFAGAVTVFSHTLASGLPTPLVVLDQDQTNVGSGAEAGDGLGTSIAMTNYRPSDQTYNSDALLAVGVPGEDVVTTADAGMVHVFRIQPSGAYTESAVIAADDLDVEGDLVAGDFFGQRVTIANTNTSVVTTTATVRLVVGIPGKDTSTVKDAGAVQIFRPLDTSVGTNDKVLTRGSGLPGTATARDYTGMALTSTAANLYVGVPYSKASDSPKGVLYALPWTDINGTTSTGTTTYLPGSGGLPDAGVAFGTVG
ncbi:VCBS repeat-containing protein [Streptomyces fulvoviolaceus]|uniref:VCBS repeat-containing protein n=1 Tax=Streptomyces fulvoviolaceus TaxID=285535 RepID=UPI0021BF5AD3|nr:VCBS repeat-containing protein [Streptomyces fulvoviolaceus]MCT9075021.1 integrin alpha [Streptomyces fulvoviolaceus]